MATQREFADFLQKVELRAYKQALFAARDEHFAMDIVQDAMMKLTSKYAEKPAEELPLLFQRILQNSIHDHFRRQKLQSLRVTLFSALTPFRDQGGKEDHESDFLETLSVTNDQSYGKNPHAELEQSQLIELIEKCLEKLPVRQREAFLLRYWEGMDVNETAKVMSCSEGSVKTHCSRASHALAAMLKEKGVKL